MTTTLSHTAVAAPRRRLQRDQVIGLLMVALGLFTAWAFGLGSAGRSHSQFTFNPVNTSGTVPWHLGALTLPTRVSCLLAGALIVAGGVEILWRRPRRALMARFGGGAVLFFLAILLWASRTHGPSQVSFVNLTSVLVGGVAPAVVLIYGSLSGVLCERAGVVNIAIEGQFLAGAFLGSLIDSVTHNFFFATLGGVVVGAGIGAILAFFALRYQSDQIIAGVVLASLVISLGSYLNLQVLTPYPQYNAGSPAPNLTIPLLAKIPVLGPVLFDENGYFYLAVVLVLLISFGLFRTRWGLRVRAVGEHPKAAASVGIDVIRTRYVNVILGGVVAGVGGVALFAWQGQFQPGITSGYGYIALAGLIFGRWRPSGVVVAALLFGMSVYLANNLQTYQVPVSTSILLMFPYVVTIFVVSGLIGRVRAPAADGIPYQRD
ncbi:MAG: ABC transporter permease [Acidobacteriota bacterium]|nr:ABC transporter permease [Acidobacteriota bacterium]MDE3043518.1 ABC transporter permease [Acidobacteriota bacterium]MDE3106621.1 ABC transporter permease [Acidobacteriota bacterium]MDE3222941.1 ABC transporter permease [Acidobacteriota bacterium]